MQHIVSGDWIAKRKGGMNHQMTYFIIQWLGHRSVILNASHIASFLNHMIDGSHFGIVQKQFNAIHSIMLLQD